jgi:hypothetical protein
MADEIVEPFLVEYEGRRAERLESVGSDSRQDPSTPISLMNVSASLID